jgi:cytochrome c biogenesis protein
MGPRSGENDPLVPAGEMRVEVYESSSGALRAATNLSQATKQEVAGLDFTFLREGRFTGLSIVKDPGVRIIWVASALMIVGLVMLFYLPHRRVWVSCKETEDGKTVVKLAMIGQRDSQTASEFENVERRLRFELRGRKPNDDAGQGGKNV